MERLYAALQITADTWRNGIGKLVTVECGNECYSGYVLALDTSVVVLQINSTKDADLFDLAYILIASITSCKSTGSICQNLVKLPKISAHQAKLKVDESVKAELEKQQHLGVGVTNQAQVFKLKFYCSRAFTILFRKPFL